LKTSRSLSWSELKVGMVVIAALLLLAVGILQLSGKAGLFTRNYMLYLRLDNANGLKVGSPVRLEGIEIGNVTDITLPRDISEKGVIIAMKVQQSYQDRIRQDSAATIKTMGLLGDKYVDLEVGSPGSPMLASGGYLKNGPESPLNRVLTGASTGIEGLNTVLGQLHQILGNVSNGHGTAGLLLSDEKLYNELTSAATSIQQTAESMHKGKGSLGKFVNEPDIYNNLLDVSAKAKDVADKLGKGSFMKLSEDEKFYQNLHDVSVNLKDVSESSKELMVNLKTGNIAKLSNDKELYAKINNISGRLDALIAKLDKGEGTAGKLLNDKELYNNMNMFFKDADALVVDFKKSPGRYVHISVF